MVGGRCHFLPKEHPESCRLDNKDLLAQATDDGFTYIPDKNTFDTLNGGTAAPLPLLGLFSRGVIPSSETLLYVAHAICHRPYPVSPSFVGRNGANGS